VTVEHQRPVVSIIIERASPRGPTVLLQQRNKAGDRFAGWLELPQGRLECGDALFVAAAREVAEETGLTLRSLRDARGVDLKVHPNPFRIVPVACVLDVENNYLGMAFIGEAIGTPRNTDEAVAHRWVEVRDLRVVVSGRGVFPLNVPMIEAYLQIAEQRHIRSST
jgi:8-oxo-dGTP pyrophosphatase MutT (NUDIX family)